MNPHTHAKANELQVKIQRRRFSEGKIEGVEIWPHYPGSRQNVTALLKESTVEAIKALVDADLKEGTRELKERYEAL